MAYGKNESREASPLEQTLIWLREDLVANWKPSINTSGILTILITKKLRAFWHTYVMTKKSM